MSWKDFFKITKLKVVLAIILFLLMFVLSFAFRNTNPTNIFTTISLNLLSWIFFLGFNIADLIILKLFPAININEIAIGGKFVLIPLIVNLFWDYFLACLLVKIYNQITRKK